MKKERTGQETTWKKSFWLKSASRSAKHASGKNRPERRDWSGLVRGEV